MNNLEVRETTGVGFLKLEKLEMKVAGTMIKRENNLSLRQEGD